MFILESLPILVMLGWKKLMSTFCIVCEISYFSAFHTSIFVWRKWTVSDYFADKFGEKGQKTNAQFVSPYEILMSQHLAYPNTDGSFLEDPLKSSVANVKNPFRTRSPILHEIEFWGYINKNYTVLSPICLY